MTHGVERNGRYAFLCCVALWSFAASAGISVNTEGLTSGIHQAIDRGRDLHRQRAQQRAAEWRRYKARHPELFASPTRTPSASGADNPEVMDTDEDQEVSHRQNRPLVESVAETGEFMGVPTYSVQCRDGSDVTFYKKDGTWSTYTLGHMGHGFDSWSIHEVARYLCQ